MEERARDTLIQRLDQLERDNRRLRMDGDFKIVGMITWALMGQAVGSSPTVEAQRVILRDSSGKIRASFGLAGDGSPLLGLNDGDGATRVVLGVFNGKPELTFSGSDGKVVWKAP